MSFRMVARATPSSSAASRIVIFLRPSNLNLVPHVGHVGISSSNCQFRPDWRSSALIMVNLCGNLSSPCARYSRPACQIWPACQIKTPRQWWWPAGGCGGAGRGGGRAPIRAQSYHKETPRRSGGLLDVRPSALRYFMPSPPLVCDSVAPFFTKGDGFRRPSDELPSR